MSQNDVILDLLRVAGDRGITPLDALEIAHSFRLAARISDLRARGYDIRTTMVTEPRRGGVTYARYVLVEKPEQLVVGL